MGGNCLSRSWPLGQHKTGGDDEVKLEKTGDDSTYGRAGEEDAEDRPVNALPEDAVADEDPRPKKSDKKDEVHEERGHFCLKREFDIDLDTEFVNANAQFAIDLLQHLSNSGNGGNIFFSPISISIALAMTLLGARGNTALEIERLTRREDVKNISKNYSALESLINSEHHEEIQLQTASRLFVDKHVELQETFKRKVFEHHRSELGQVDFVSDPEATCKRINRWIMDKTGNRIKDCLSPGSIVPSLSTLLLVNAIYFKAKWDNEFDTVNTRKDNFFVEKQLAKRVNMMKLKQTFQVGYDRKLSAFILEMPYRGLEIKMFVLLPKSFDGLKKLTKALTTHFQDSTLRRLRIRETVVSLPRFSIEDSLSLETILPGMGVRDLFEPETADLSGMDGGSNHLYLSQALHKTFIEVDEEGTEAAAATLLTFAKLTFSGRRRPKPKPVQFKVNRPFLFLITHAQSGSILFLGKVVDLKGDIVKGVRWDREVPDL